MKIQTMSLALATCFGIVPAMGQTPLYNSDMTSIASANSKPSVIYGKDLLPLAQGRQSQELGVEGLKSLSDGNLAAAEAKLRKAVALDDTNADASAGLARALELENKNTEAIAVYHALISPKPHWGTSLEQDVIVRMRYATLLANAGSWTEAVSIYKTTIDSVHPGSALPGLNVVFDASSPQPILSGAMAHLAMGIEFDNRGEYSEALQEYSKASKVLPSSPLIGFYYGYGARRAGKFAEAKAAFAAAGAKGDAEVKAAAQEELQQIP